MSLRSPGSSVSSYDSHGERATSPSSFSDERITPDMNNSLLQGSCCLPPKTISRKASSIDDDMLLQSGPVLDDLDGAVPSEVRRSTCHATCA
ncbi:hypothetical protein AUP68_14543 [Ilyonectria robusta]